MPRSHLGNCQRRRRNRIQRDRQNSADKVIGLINRVASREQSFNRAATIGGERINSISSIQIERGDDPLAIW